MNRWKNESWFLQLPWEVEFSPFFGGDVTCFSGNTVFLCTVLSVDILCTGDSVFFVTGTDFGIVKGWFFSWIFAKYTLPCLCRLANSFAITS